MKYTLAIAILIISIFFSGCISASSSAGGQAGASAKGKQQSERKAEIKDTNDIDIEPTVIELPLALFSKEAVAKMKETVEEDGTRNVVIQGNVLKIITGGLRIKSGTTTSSKSENKQEVEADAFASMKANSKSSVQMIGWILLICLAMLLYIVIKIGIPTVKKFIKP